MSEKDANGGESLRNVDLMSQSTTSNTGDVDKAMADMKKQILTLQSENSSLKRQIPRMKDMEGNDITENVKQLCDDLAKAEQGNEQWQNKYAESEQKLSRFQRKMQCELDTRDTQIAQLKACAKALEEDNERLKKKAENDLSKLYHLQNGADASDQHDLSLGAFEKSFEPDSVSQIKQELDEKVKENKKLTQQLGETMKVVENLKKTIETQTEAIKRVCTRVNTEDDSVLSLPNVNTESEAVVANVLFILRQLDENKCDQNQLQEDIINIMRKNGYNIDSNRVAKLSKEYEKTFRSKLTKCRDEIKCTNYELAEECSLDNAKIFHQLNRLSNDSVFSSNPAYSQQVSFALESGKKTLGIDILNRTIDVAQDLGSIVARMNGLREIGNQLFEKLQGTAKFLQSLLNALEDSEEGKELVLKINAIKLDLDKSMAEARSLVDEVKKAEKSVNEFHTVLQQTINNQTIEENSLIQEENAREITIAADLVDGSKQEIERLKSIEVQCESLKNCLNKELAYKKLLNDNITELKSQKEENELTFKQVIQALQDKIAEHEVAALTFFNSLEEKNRLLEGLKSEVKIKDDELAKAEQDIQRWKGLLAESNKGIGIARSQITELSYKYQSNLISSSEQQKELEEKVSTIALFEVEKSVLISQKEELVRQMQVAEAELSFLRSESTKVIQEKASLENKYNELSERLESKQTIVASGNEELYEKISKDSFDESFDNTFTEDPNEEDDLSDFDHFSNFLQDCRKQSNKLVQMIKKVEILIIECDPKLPHLKSILHEARAIRLLLHKISKFFESQKSNLKNTNKKLGCAIREELKNIYDTLRTAAQTSHSKVAAIRRDSPVGTNQK